MRLLLSLVVLAVAAGAVWAMLSIGCDSAPDFVLWRGACDRGVEESATQIAAGVAVVIGLALLLDARRRRR